MLLVIGNRTPLTRLCSHFDDTAGQRCTGHAAGEIAGIGRSRCRRGGGTRAGDRRQPVLAVVGIGGRDAAHGRSEAGEVAGGIVAHLGGSPDTVGLLLPLLFAQLVAQIPLTLNP